PWPGARLRHPPLLPSPGFRLRDGVLEAGHRPTATRRGRQLSAGRRDLVLAVEEIYLELLRVDLDDDESILDFANRFRTVGVRHDNFESFRDFPRFEQTVRPQLEAAWPGDTTGPGLVQDESLDDFRFGANCLRDLVTAWQVVQGSEQEPRWLAPPKGTSWI